MGDDIITTFYLFARPSFIEGASRILDLGATMQDYNKKNIPSEADYIAISNDWRTVGKDIKIALDQYGQEK